MIDLRESWRIGPVEVPTRLVLAPMAGVSVQAFRRQGRRYGAGLVCSEMVSCAGIEHRNEKTLGYLRVAADEHPLAIQLFGSEPRTMAEGARMVEAVGADIVDVNFGCPVKKVTKTGAGAHLLEDPDRACAIVGAIADAVDIPVTVKLRRGVHNGSRAALELGPRLVDAGASSLTLHPRSAQQMYTGTADHVFTAEFVSLVHVPVVASGDVTSRARAQAVLATTGADAVMVGRGAQGNPWALREIVDGDASEPSREEVAAELVLFVRETVRELGERRASGFLKKFYGWYLGRGRFPKEFKQELLQLDSTEEVERRLLAAAPGAHEIVERLEAEVPSGAELTLELPVSDLRRRLVLGAADERGRDPEPDVHGSADVALRPHEAARAAQHPSGRPGRDAQIESVTSPRSAKSTPRNAICTAGCGALGSTNCGRNARKKSAVFGFRTLTTMPCANARRRLRSPPSATSASGCLEKSVHRPSPTRYTAPAILTAVNATADDRTSAESPSVAAVMCTSVPT